MHIDFSDIEQAYDYANFGSPGDHSAFLSKETGRVCYVSQLGDSDELPDDLEDDFQVAAISGSPQVKCRRYDRMRQKLIESQGAFSSDEAMALLEAVSKWNTEWSIVYGMSTGLVTVAMDRKFREVHSFHLGHLAEK